MLRAIRLKNFVKIHEDYLLSFPKDGAYFFVGENGTGKSSIFEAIRRCLSRNSNATFSRMPEASKPTYIICKYEIPAKVRSFFYSCKQLFTAFVHIPDADSCYKYAKIVILLREDGAEDDHILIDVIERKNSSHEMTTYRCVFQSEDHILKRKITEELLQSTNDDEQSNKHIEELLKSMKNLLSNRNLELHKYESEMFETSETEKRKEPTMDEILTKLDDLVVCTFGLRSVGPLQWSKSTRIAKEYREENYRSAREKCEIIAYFMSKENTAKYDREKEQEIFQILTDGADYIFETEENGDRKEVRARLDGQPVDVLKMSEGILEAKYLSLILSSTEFFTVSLEEPDRGMHPQMIQMIRDIVLPHVREKTIIIVSHNPIFIASWSIPKTYKFYKEQEGKDWIHKMVNVGKVAQKDKNRIPRLLASEDYVSMIFARRVIFVEGTSDFLFFKALTTYMLNPTNEDSIRKVLELITTRQPFQGADINKLHTDLRSFLASLHVVKLMGERNKEKWHDLSKALGIARLFLLDMDAVVEVTNVDACNQTSSEVRETISAVAKSELNTMKKNKIEGAEQLTKVQIDRFPGAVNEAFKCRFSKLRDPSQKHSEEEENKNDQEDTLSLSEAETKMQNVTKNIVGRIVQSGNISEVETIVNAEDDRIYHQYFCKKYTHLLHSSSTDGPVSTKYRLPNNNQWIISENQQKEFKKCIQKDDWNNGRGWLEKDGVFVWRRGSLEDAFVDLVTNYKQDNGDQKEMELLKRYMLFAGLGIDLNPSKLPTKKQAKLYMDDKVSDENINDSISLALHLCEENSDMTQFICFLVMCAQGKVDLTPWTKKPCKITFPS